MLGLNGLVIKGHGNSDAKTVCNAIRQCVLQCSESAD